MSYKANFKYNGIKDQTVDYPAYMASVNIYADGGDETVSVFLYALRNKDTLLNSSVWNERLDRWSFSTSGRISFDCVYEIVPSQEKIDAINTDLGKELTEQRLASYIKKARKDSQEIGIVISEKDF